MSDHKVCTMCKCFLPLERFGKNTKLNRVIVRSACKDCTNKKKKEQRLKNPERVKQILRQSYQRHRQKRLEYARNKRAALLAKKQAEQTAQAAQEPTPPTDTAPPENKED